MPSDEVELFQSAYQEYVNTNERQLDSQEFLNEKSIEVIKVNLLVGSLAASVVTFRPNNIAIPYFVAGSTTLLSSIWFCAKVYSPTAKYDIGISGDQFDQMKNSEDLESHFEDMAKSYRSMVSDFNSTYKTESDNFQKGLWFSIATLFLYIFGAGSTLFISISNITYSWFIDGIVILGIGLLMMYGKCESSKIGEKD
jgi:hypothetical protein